MERDRRTIKMKKTLIFLLASLFVLSGCRSNNNKKQDEDKVGPGGNDPDQQNPIDETPEAFKDATFKFYLDYSHSDDPLLTFKWYIGKPLQVCPEVARLTDANASDPLYPHFLGYSTHSSSNDESYLWDFKTDVATTQSAVLLYGIWVGD